MVRKILELAGCETSIIHAFHEEIYPMLRLGEIDIFTATWLPSAHAEFWNPSREKVMKIGSIFKGGAFFLAVPGYVHEKGVTTIADLRQSGVDRTIFSVGPGGAVLTARAKAAIEAYGLSRCGFRLVPLEENEWATQARAAVAARKRFAIAAWQPCFLPRELSLRRLDDPRGVMGPDDTGWITANAKFVSTADKAVINVLERCFLGVDVISALDGLVAKDGLNATEAAETWTLHHPCLVNQILNP